MNSVAMSYYLYSILVSFFAGAGLDKFPKYSEKTNDHLCTQYSSRNCDKY